MLALSYYSQSSPDTTTREHTGGARGNLWAYRMAVAIVRHQRKDSQTLHQQGCLTLEEDPMLQI